MSGLHSILYWNNETVFNAISDTDWQIKIWSTGQANSFYEKTLKFISFPYIINTFSGQVRKFFTCPAEILTCPGQPDNGFVRPCSVEFDQVWVYIMCKSMSLDMFLGIKRIKAPFHTRRQPYTYVPVHYNCIGKAKWLPFFSCKVEVSITSTQKKITSQTD